MCSAVRPRIRPREFASRVLGVARFGSAAALLCIFLAACVAPQAPYAPSPAGIDDFRYDTASTQPISMTGEHSDPEQETQKPVQVETAQKSRDQQIADSGEPAKDTPDPPQQALLSPPTEIIETIAEEPAAGAVIPGALRPVVRPDTELLIVQIQYRNYILTDAVEAYQNGGGLLLPLGEFVRALDFPITIDPESGRADGWFLNENRLFSLDLAQGEVVIDGMRRPVPPGMVELHEQDIFVDTRTLATWFPLNIDFQLSYLNVKVASETPLPFERKLARDHLRARISDRRAGQTQEQLPRHNQPYVLASPPFLDATISAQHQADGSGGSSSQGDYSLLLTGDLLYMNSRLFLSGSDSDALSVARWELGRRDPEFGLLGPLSASEFAMGDIANSSDSLVASSVFGRGARISNFPLDRANEFDRITLRGELPPGWDAELYRNGAILEILEPRSDGLYEFTDVPLVFGLNHLRVVLHGPQGQKREDVRRYMVGPGMVRPGEFNYRLSAAQHNTGLLPVENDRNQGSAIDPRDGQGRAVSQFEYGLSSSLSVAGGVSSLPLASGQRNYGTLGLRAVAGSVFGRLDVTGDDTGGQAGILALQGRLSDNFSLSVEHGMFENFLSERIKSEHGFLESRTSAGLNGTFSLPPLPNLAIGLAGHHERWASDRESFKFTQQLSAPIGRLAFSSRHAGTRISGISDSLTGQFLVGGSFRSVYLRGALGYSVLPDWQFTSATVSSNWRIDADLSGTVGLSYGILNDHVQLNAGVSRRFGVAALGASAQMDNDGGYGGRVALTFGVGMEPRSGAYMAQAQSVAENGSVSARAFLDHNNNGKFDEGDKPLPGVRFRTGSGRGGNETDENGVAFLTGLAPNRRANIQIAANSIEDPYWVPTSPGLSILPRPGVSGIVEFPIVPTSEIDGTVFELVDGRREKVSNVQVQLVDASGRVVKEVRSGFDGFYLFERVIPGDYRVRVNPDQMARLNFVAPPERQVALAPEQVANGENMDISRRTAIAEAGPETRPETPAQAPPAQTAEAPQPSEETSPPESPPPAESAETPDAPAPPPAEAPPTETAEAPDAPLPAPAPATPRTEPPRATENLEPIPPKPVTEAPQPDQTAEAPQATETPAPPTPMQRKVRQTARNMACPVIRFVVKPGHSLWRIARVFYGNGRRYPVLYDANGDKIRDPNLIYPGQLLVIPWREGMNAEAVAAAGLKEAGQNSALVRAPECSAHRVVVKPGDNLWRIARRIYGSGTKNMRLFKANRKSIRIPDLIYPGQILYLPRLAGHDDTVPEVPASPRRTAPRPGAPSTLASGQRRVIVQPGDSLWRIARRAYGRGSRNLDLFRHNHHQVPVPDRIYPGQVIILPSPEELSRIGARRRQR